MQSLRLPEALVWLVRQPDHDVETIFRGKQTRGFGTRAVKIEQLQRNVGPMARLRQFVDVALAGASRPK